MRKKTVGLGKERKKRFLRKKRRCFFWKDGRVLGVGKGDKGRFLSVFLGCTSTASLAGVLKKASLQNKKKTGW